MAVKLLDERPAGSGSRYRDALQGISITANPASPVFPFFRLSARGFARVRDLAIYQTGTIERIEIGPPRRDDRRAATRFCGRRI